MKITLELKDSEIEEYVRKRNALYALNEEMEVAKKAAAKYFNLEGVDFSAEGAAMVTAASDEVNHCIGIIKDSFWQSAVEKIDKKYKGVTLPPVEAATPEAPAAEAAAPENLEPQFMEDQGAAPESVEPTEPPAEENFTLTHEESPSVPSDPVPPPLEASAPGVPEQFHEDPIPEFRLEEMRAEEPAVMGSPDMPF